MSSQIVLSCPDVNVQSRALAQLLDAVVVGYKANWLDLVGAAKDADGLYKVPGRKEQLAIALPVKNHDIDPKSWEWEDPRSSAYTKVCLYCLTIENRVRWVHRDSFTWLCRPHVFWLLSCRRRKNGNATNPCPPKKRDPKPFSYGPSKAGLKSRRAILVFLSQQDMPIETKYIRANGLSRRVVLHHLQILQDEGWVDRSNYSPASWQIKSDLAPTDYSLIPGDNQKGAHCFTIATTSQSVTG